MRKSLFLTLACLAVPAFAQQSPPLDAKQLAMLVETYKTIHSHPELSHFEKSTSALLAENLRKAGYEVSEHIGVYPDGSKAFGVVGVLKNGPGPTLMIRADMDALPIVE